MYAVEARGLGRKYGDVWGLRDASFSVDGGSLAVLAGPNGAGKTTTVRILTTFLRPSQGWARVMGMDVLRDYRDIRRRTSYLPQEYGVSRDLTPMEAVMWNLVARGWPIGEARAQARRWLELLGIWDLRDRTCWTLSGGERRRVAVAMALSPEPDVIFLDEPTVGLDVEIKHLVWRVIREIVSEGATILMTTHDMAEAEMLADKVVMLNDGRTIAEEEPRRLVERLPYRYRVVVRKLGELEDAGFGVRSIDLGDRVILYAKSRGEAVRLVDELSAVTDIHSVNRVGLEDAYLHIIGRSGRS